MDFREWGHTGSGLKNTMGCRQNDAANLIEVVVYTRGCCSLTLCGAQATHASILRVTVYLTWPDVGEAKGQASCLQGDQAMKTRKWTESQGWSYQQLCSQGWRKRFIKHCPELVEIWMGAAYRRLWLLQPKLHRHLNILSGAETSGGARA